MNDTILESLSKFNVLRAPRVRPAKTLQELQEVYRLTHDCYVGSGYAAPHPSGLLLHYPYFDHLSETTVFIALVDGKIAGSISITLDGPNGFSIENEFKAECDAIRAEGRRVAAAWRLVVNESLRDRMIVMDLIRGAVEHVLKNEVGTVLLSINPKHESIYNRCMNMERVTRNSQTQGLSNAPAVLMRADPALILRKRPAESPSYSPALLLATSYY
jgi:hypothetical protein